MRLELSELQGSGLGIVVLYLEAALTLEGSISERKVWGAPSWGADFMHNMHKNHI